MSPIPKTDSFGLLPEKRPPWMEFGFGIVAQCTVIAILAWVAVLHPEVIVPPAHEFSSMRLVDTPVPVNHVPAPVFRMRSTPVVIAQESKALVLRPMSESRPKPEEIASVPQIVVPASKIDPITPNPAVMPRQLVRMNVLSEGSSAVPTMARAPQKVQTGGFGDPNGVPSKANPGHPVTIAQLGSFDLPGGPGNGNGAGGERGTRGVVSSAGFGNGIATGDGSGRTNASRGTVQQGQFGDVAAISGGRAKQPASAAPITTPAEVLSKPNPAYTEQARKLRIEGEVLLEVVLEASGKVIVQRVVRGLGYGLDEEAVRSAQQIRFKPAMRENQPANSTVIVHVVFQLT